MISSERKDQLLRWCGVYYAQGYSLSRAIEAMQATTEEELDLVVALWAEEDVNKINEIMERF